jgi:hypothetical protein
MVQAELKKNRYAHKAVKSFFQVESVLSSI